MRRRFFYILIAIFHFPLAVNAQPCTQLGQNPPTAFPVCGTLTFTQSSVPLCGTRPIPVSCFDGASYMDKNPFWYKFTCYTAGTLGFTITPMVLADDYDWHLFDVTNQRPDDVFIDPSLFVAANWSFNSGTTGASTAGTNLLECAASPVTFSQMPTLIVGHQYLLLVSHYTNTQSGYQLTFGGGTASITDPNIPVITSAIPDCEGSKIIVKFSKALKCNSLTATGSEFILSPSGTIATALGHGCSSGFTIDSVTLTTSVPLAPGNYTISAVPGTDGNTLLDNCDAAIATGNAISFTIPMPPPLPMGVTQGSICAPTSVTIQFPDPIRCNSIAANGSDFIISGPSPVTISGVNMACNSNNETNTITIEFTAPILVGGIYMIQVTNGSDGNTLLGTCNRPVPAGSAVEFNLPVQPPLPMGTVNPPTCSPVSVRLDFNESINCNSIASDGSDFIITGGSTVTILGAVPTCTGGVTNSVTLQLSSPITLGGNYQVEVRLGTDGNTLTGNCMRVVPSGASTSFTVPLVFPASITSVNPGPCEPQRVRVVLDMPVKCSSITSNGSEFTVLGPSTVNVVSAMDNCSSGFTTIIDVQFSAPITVGGSYILHLVPGTDGNTLLNDCDLESRLSSLFFVVGDTLSADFDYSIVSDCNTNQVTFSAVAGNVSSWNWTINGTPAGTQPVISQTFPATSQPVVQLTVTNGNCSKTHTEILDFANGVIVDFDFPPVICPEDSVIFINRSSGPVDEWAWNFGNGSISNMQHPASQLYPVNGLETFYTVSLTGSNNNGCVVTKTKTIKIQATCLIAVPTAFTPNNDGLNDHFYPMNAFKADDLEFKVYNRWGQLVFHTNDWTKQWDGKLNGIPQSTGVYVWFLRYTHRDTGRKEFQKGTTLLIR
jgi:gliding motility-associated-like protein